MNLTVTTVPHGHIHEVFEFIVPFMKKSIDWTFDRMGVDDIANSIFGKHALLWLVFDQDDKSIHGYLTTEIREYPLCKNMVVLHCGGVEGSLEACVGMVFDTFERFAASNGCNAIEIQGRAAWAKFVKGRGYDTQMRHYFKKIGV